VSERAQWLGLALLVAVGGVYVFYYSIRYGVRRREVRLFGRREPIRGRGALVLAIYWLALSCFWIACAVWLFRQAIASPDGQ
jgi:hypothetical protein